MITHIKAIMILKLFIFDPFLIVEPVAKEWSSDLGYVYQLIFFNSSFLALTLSLAFS